MAKPLKIWNGTEWVEVAIAVPSGYATLTSPVFTGSVTLPHSTFIDNVYPLEISYLDGVTSSIQSQLDSKATSATVESSQSNQDILNIAGAL